MNTLHGNQYHIKLLFLLITKKKPPKYVLSARCLHVPIFLNNNKKKKKQDVLSFRHKSKYQYVIWTGNIPRSVCEWRDS